MFTDDNGHVLVDDIDGAFVPRQVDNVLTAEVGDEAVLVNTETGALHLLNPTGSVVWSCFDGSVDLDSLVDELAEAFETPRDLVRDDVMALTQRLGWAGLLAGVSRPTFRTPEADTAATGEELVPFRLPTLAGDPLDLSDLRGQRVLLVNWSPFCGFCISAAAELADLTSDLEQNGARLVLLAAGAADRNRALAEEHGLTAPILLREGATEEFADPFPGMGTPVAYLLDEDGRLAEPIAQGAIEVAAVARRVAGRPEPEVRTDRNYIGGGSSGVCAPGAGGAKKKTREWMPTVAYKIAEFDIGIRAASPAAHDLVGRFLAAHRVGEDPDAPANFSVILTDPAGGAARDLNLLLEGDMSAVVRSRSRQRVLHGLAAHLSSLLPLPDERLLRTLNMGAIIGDEAVLLPAFAWSRLEQLQPRLARLGVRIVDEPYAIIDLERAELVVSEPTIDVDLSALDEVNDAPLGRTEAPRVEPGRYKLRTWGLWGSGEPDEQPTRAKLVFEALWTIAEPPARVASTADPLLELFDRVPALMMPPGKAEDVAAVLKQYITA